MSPDPDQEGPVDVRKLDEDVGADPDAFSTSPAGTTPSETMDAPPEEAIMRDPNTELSVNLPQAQGQLIGKPPTKSRKKTGSTDEELPIILPGMWVKLSYESKNVPDYVKGEWAAVFEAPRFDCTDEECKHGIAGRRHEHQADDVPISVRTRDSYNANLVVTREDIMDISPNGRPLTRA